MSRKKIFITPKGKIIELLGYEHFAIRDILLSGVNEDDIITGIKNVPIVHYKFKGKNLRYFTDFFIKSENRFIEVKSHFTYICDYRRNLQKMRATKNSGYDVQIWIYDRKGNKVKEISFK